MRSQSVVGRRLPDGGTFTVKCLFAISLGVQTTLFGPALCHAGYSCHLPCGRSSSLHVALVVSRGIRLNVRQAWRFLAGWRRCSIGSSGILHSPLPRGTLERVPPKRNAIVDKRLEKLKRVMIVTAGDEMVFVVGFTRRPETRVLGVWSPSPQCLPISSPTSRSLHLISSLVVSCP